MQQKKLPAFLRTAEDLQVKGLTEKEGSMQEQDATIENSEVEKVNTESPDLAPQIPKPLQITPKVEKQNIRAGTNEKEQQGESSCTKTMKSRKTESKQASKRAVNNENSPNNKKRRSSSRKLNSFNVVILLLTCGD